MTLPQPQIDEASLLEMWLKESDSGETWPDHQSSSSGAARQRAREQAGELKENGNPEDQQVIDILQQAIHQNLLSATIEELQTTCKEESKARTNPYSIVALIE